ncbi:MAG TPA: hypothetical protein VIL99_10990 [Ignavibacteria bacterium]
MMKEYTINLTLLVNPPFTDSISGREFGEQHAKDTQVLKHIHDGEKIVLTIDSEFVKAINDSFIKGFFSKIFEKYHTVEKIKSFVELRSNDNFQRLFEKNWAILEAINNA